MPTHFKYLLIEFAVELIKDITTC